MLLPGADHFFTGHLAAMQLALANWLKVPGHDANIDITNDGGAEINILNAVGYTLVPTTVSNLPVISQSGVVAHGGKSTTIEPGAFIDIYGTNLSTTTQTATFSGNFPTTLGNVSVKIDGKSAYVYYISSGLINVQAPDDTALGTVNVTVTNSVGTSAAVTATLGKSVLHFSHWTARTSPA